ncbi:hypothetical protein MKQ68_01750 [Chitinophaga horti]|uniref:Uncharacterized protein n=1 Tax=Chitinophaga horti TaxID=2920382 RepID=A0ABY6J2B5_9BACT|nr:hypothetical protein [Chitinophaga horti]UYQ93818.1 hypothetical protein MKQ68_01750 [Chitinophaga horti]
MTYKKTTLLLLSCLLSLSLCAQTTSTRSLKATAEKHRQRYQSSCIPSSVEMILKYNNKVNADFYDFQNAWQNKNTGTFGDFDGKTIKGITFTHQFKNPRSPQFPFDKLFQTIDAELKAGRKVIVSLQSGAAMWHIWIIDSATKNGDYLCYSRDFYDNGQVLETRETKQWIRNMQGTDILTYRVK